MVILKKSVDQERFKTFGQRNSFISEVDNIDQQIKILNNVIIEKQKRLDRNSAQLESLNVIESHQISIIKSFENI